MVNFLQGFQDLMSMPSPMDVRYQVAQKAARGKAEDEAMHQAATNEAIRTGANPMASYQNGMPILDVDRFKGDLGRGNDYNLRRGAGAGGTLDILNRLGAGGTAQLGFMSPLSRQGPSAEDSDIQKMSDEDEKRFWEAKRARLGANAFGELLGSSPGAPGFARGIAQQDYRENR